MTHLTPLHVGGDAWLIRSLPGDGADRRRYLNALVLRGPQPVLVDTGAPTTREAWWEQVESLVDPGDVRWIFLSHDDLDHRGNLVEALDRCPQATLLVSWHLAQRLAPLVDLPPDRCRWVDDGEAIGIGDRRLFALRPPAYDAPTTRGLYDATSGVYWAADCFGTPVPHEVDEVADLDRDVWTDGFLEHHRLLSPWVTDVEALRWRAAVGRVAALGARVVASAHGPAIRGPHVLRALDLLADVPDGPAVPRAGQRDERPRRTGAEAVAAG